MILKKSLMKGLGKCGRETFEHLRHRLLGLRFYASLKAECQASAKLMNLRR